MENGKSVCFCQRHALSTSFNIFVVTKWMTNFLPKLVDMPLYSMEKTEFLFFNSPIFGFCWLFWKRKPLQFRQRPNDAFLINKIPEAHPAVITWCGFHLGRGNLRQNNKAAVPEWRPCSHRSFVTFAWRGRFQGGPGLGKSRQLKKNIKLQQTTKALKRIKLATWVCQTAIFLEFSQRPHWGTVKCWDKHFALHVTLFDTDAEAKCFC